MSDWYTTIIRQYEAVEAIGPIRSRSSALIVLDLLRRGVRVAKDRSTSFGITDQRPFCPLVSLEEFKAEVERISEGAR